MITELEMKEALDGWFYVYNCEQQSVMRRKVSKDHIPCHKPRILDEDQKPKTGYPWTDTEDERLVKLREANLVWTEIAHRFRMSPSAVKNRYLVLCLKSGRAEHRVNRTPDTVALERRVVDLKTQELTFDQIAVEMGLSRNQVAGLWRRWRKRSDQWEEAA